MDKASARRKDYGRKAYGKWKAFLPWIFLIAVFIFYIWFIHIHADKYLDADMSSEMVLSDHLAKIGGILTDDWYYSTELRVMNIQIIMSLVFRFTDNWLTVRIVSSAILMSLLLASFYLLCREMRIKRAFPVCAGLLMLPFCKEYFKFVMLGLYYIPHISFAFLSVGLLFHYRNAQKTMDQVFTIAACLTVSFLTALGGIRQIIVTYIPIFLASFIKMAEDIYHEKKLIWKWHSISYFTCSLFFLAGSLIGYWINSTVLANRYTFKKYELAWIPVSFENMAKEIRTFLTFFGYEEGNVFSSVTVRNIIAIFLLTVVIIYFFHTFRRSNAQCDNKCEIVGIVGTGDGKSDGEEITTNNGIVESRNLFVLIILSGLFCLTVLYAFTDMLFEVRYFLPVTVCLIGVFGAEFGESDTPDRLSEKKKIVRNSKLHRLLCWVVVCLITLTSILNYADIAKIDDNAEIRQIVSFLTDEGYHNGYSTFWNANLITELSNGQVEIHDWLNTNTVFDLKNVDRFHHWLQLKQRKEIAPGRLFLLFSKNEFESYTICQNLQRDDAIYDNAGYLIFGYDSYEEMKADVET